MKMSIRALLISGAVLPIILAASGCGPEQYKSDKSTVDQFGQRANSGQPVYTPPPNIPGVTAPKPGGGGPGGGPGAPGGAPYSPPMGTGVPGGK
jgi:hypothetical protein